MARYITETTFKEKTKNQEPLPAFSKAHYPHKFFVVKTTLKM